jgi:hypothetical protein
MMDVFMLVSSSHILARLSIAFMALHDLAEVGDFGARGASAGEQARDEGDLRATLVANMSVRHSSPCHVAVGSHA